MAQKEVWSATNMKFGMVLTCWFLIFQQVA